MKADLSRWAPPGYDLTAERRLFSTGLPLSAAACVLLFLRAYLRERDGLYLYKAANILWPGARMPDFADLLRTSQALTCFWVVPACLAAFAVLHYLYFVQESRSIYTMRRLPDRWELHRRCLTLPLLGIAACALAALAALCLCFALYMLCTPAACLTPGQWQKIWRTL